MAQEPRVAGKQPLETDSIGEDQIADLKSGLQSPCKTDRKERLDRALSDQSFGELGGARGSHSAVTQEDFPPCRASDHQGQTTGREATQGAQPASRVSGKRAATTPMGSFKLKAISIEVARAVYRIFN